jgi:hypothetical protein
MSRDRQTSVLLFLVMGHNFYIFSARDAGHQNVDPGLKASWLLKRSVLPGQPGNGSPGSFPKAGAVALRLRHASHLLCRSLGAL